MNERVRRELRMYLTLALMAVVFGGLYELLFLAVHGRWAPW